LIPDDRVSFSVILPTLNEADCIAGAITSLRRLGPCEIIVADGGSRDDTLARAGGADLVLSGPRGRAAQMNHGAAHARGDVLVFLHADCTLEAGALATARRSLARPGVAAGCFRMTVTAPGLTFRLIDAAATLRVRLTGIAYGDQGLFVRRDMFDRVGGFPAMGFMEDVTMSRALRPMGRVVVASARVFVSDRRWRKVGVVRQTLRNWTLTALAVAGVHPERLARHYPAVR
jgi:rSAM/selenodomain-associated transferase 2